MSNEIVLHRPIKSFKEVHEELEKEATFLTMEHDVREFKAKSDSLSSIGFTSSIATRLYGAVAENHKMIKAFQERYEGIIKFIILPQLERISEKYNLYVRDIADFIGDIPEENINDMLNFKVCVEDLPEDFVEVVTKMEALKSHTASKIREAYKDNFMMDYSNPMGMNYKTNAFISLTELGELYQEVKELGIQYKRQFAQPIIQIAATKEMFADKAFERSEARILSAADWEPIAKAQVDLDPIVLVRTKKSGFLIPTAWGDEANDELLAK